MIIRRMEENDLEEVCKIEQSIFNRPWKYADFKKSCEDDNNIYIVVEEAGEIVGYCGLWGVAGEGQINNVAVSMKHRNKKIASSMLSNLILLGRDKKLKSFTLEVRESNLFAIKLYKNLGFTCAGVRKNFYEEPKENALIMWIYE